MERFGGQFDEHIPPWERPEGKMIERIEAMEELKKIIRFSNDTVREKNPHDIIDAARDYVSRLGGVDIEAIERFNNLIKMAEEELNKRRLVSAKESLKGISDISKVHDMRKSKNFKA